MRQDELRQELSVSLYGEMQKQVIEATLAADFGVDVRFRPTTTICIERPAGSGAAADIMDEDANPFLATVGLRVDPAPEGAGNTFGLEVELGSMPSAFFTAVEESVRRTLRQGVHGWEVTDCAVTMTHSGYSARQSHAHAVFDKSMSSTAGDFRNLTPLVLMTALQRAGTTVSEPVHRFHLELPADTVGPVLPVLAQLGAVPGPPAIAGAACTLEGEIPAARVHELRGQLPALTRGEGMLESAFERHQPVRGKVPERPPLRRRPARPRGLPAAGQPPTSAAMKATSSPSASGSSGSRVAWSPLSAASRWGPSATPTAAAAAPSVAARTSARGRATGPKRAHVDGGLRLGERGLVVLARVEVAHALRVREVLEPARVAALEQRRRAELPGGDQLAEQRRERGPVGGRERLAVGVEHRHGRVGPVRRGAYGGDEPGMQERHVGRHREGQVPVDGLQAGEQALQRAPALARVLDDADAARQLRQLLPRRADDDHRPAGPARHQPARAPQQRRAVPVQPRLGRAHAARAAARKHDARGHGPSLSERPRTAMCARCCVLHHVCGYSRV